MTGKLGVQKFMGLQRVRHDLETEQEQQCNISVRGGRVAQTYKRII